MAAELQPQPPSLRERLKLCVFNYAACISAIRGEKIPHDLGHPAHEISVVRGIRYHDGYGEELRGLSPLFTRALNARCIMSNKIPTIDHEEERPYCIWHPTTATEHTYRQLAQAYPQMAYQVGRACAVAGYTQLYQELDILADVHIAEEARECGNHAIHDLIVSQSTRYSIMNDYTSSIHPDNLTPAFLNGDTAACWMLDLKQEVIKNDVDYVFEEGGRYMKEWEWPAPRYDDPTFDITEDKLIDEYTSDAVQERQQANRLEVELLTQPLPTDLPTVQKDLLIRMAAYRGDIDRYVRLRRPKPVYGEYLCCTRGIYHNTFFALWHARNTKDTFSQPAAVNARMIMNNVLAGAPYKAVPYLIWWPTIASQSTYRKLAQIQPSMSLQIVHACIVAGYRDLFDELLPLMTPNSVLVREAELQVDTHFRKALDERRERLNDIIDDPGAALHWTSHLTRMQYSGSTAVDNMVTKHNFSLCWDFPYNGRSCDASSIELFACLPEAWKLPMDDDSDYGRVLDYEDWPPNAAAMAVEVQDK